jgi:catechol 2,3-dioxygenase-like lactoylglutathione lyase family enzyme
MIIDHIGINVSDLERSKAFYAAALAPLGISELMAPAPGVVGYGAPPKPEFWLVQRDDVGAPLHVAFATDRATVDAFHEAALGAGGTDNGGPGERPIYHPGYYGAYVLDPDGHNIEAVSHRA